MKRSKRKKKENRKSGGRYIRAERLFSVTNLCKNNMIWILTCLRTEDVRLLILVKISTRRKIISCSRFTDCINYLRLAYYPQLLLFAKNSKDGFVHLFLA